MTEIILHSKGEDFTVIIDEEDFDKVSKHTWCIDHNKSNNKYCQTNIKVNGKIKKLYLHRFIMGLDFGEKRIINHKNGNGLDNRKSNLEFCDNCYNTQSLNTRKNFGNIYIKNDGSPKKYFAQVVINKKKYRKCFFTLEDAATWLDDMKEFALYINEPFHS